MGDKRSAQTQHLPPCPERQCLNFLRIEEEGNVLQVIGAVQAVQAVQPVSLYST